jgi:hypothetical protein
MSKAKSEQDQELYIKMYILFDSMHEQEFFILPPALGPALSPRKLAAQAPLGVQEMSM